MTTGLARHPVDGRARRPTTRFACRKKGTPLHLSGVPFYARPGDCGQPASDKA